ncbi:PREDICTED: aspartic proteinase nepenthesin-2-like [Fragaria vesca subsp. vesca]
MTLLLFMFTFMLPIATCGFSIQLIPIDSVILPTNHTPEERHNLLANISRNRALNLMSMSAARAMNPKEEFVKGVPNTIQPPIYRVLSNYYVTRMVIGSRLYTPYLMVDTGSADTWVQCDGCRNCFPIQGGNFKYNESTTYKYLPCKNPLCVPKLCDSAGVCLYRNLYSGGSKSEGWVSSDTFLFSSTNHTSMKLPVAFGCGYDNQNMSFGHNDGPSNPIAGIFGLGIGTRSILKQLGKETNQRFSYCLPSSRTSRQTHTMISFGEDAQIKGSVQTIQILPAENTPAYNVKLLGISIAGKRLNIDPALFQLKRSTIGGFFIDTGSPYTRLVQGAYTILRDEMTQYIMKNYGKRPTRKGFFDLCYGSLGGNVTLPSMTYHFKGANLVLNSGAVFERFGFDLCMAILPASNAGQNLLGAFQQANHRFLFDVGKKSMLVKKYTVSFAPEICL